MFFFKVAAAFFWSNDSFEDRTVCTIVGPTLIAQSFDVAVRHSSSYRVMSYDNIRYAKTFAMRLVEENGVEYVALGEVFNTVKKVPIATFRQFGFHAEFDADSRLYTIDCDPSSDVFKTKDIKVSIQVSKKAGNETVVKTLSVGQKMTIAGDGYEVEVIKGARTYFIKDYSLSCSLDRARPR